MHSISCTIYFITICTIIHSMAFTTQVVSAFLGKSVERIAEIFKQDAESGQVGLRNCLELIPGLIRIKP